MEFLCDKIQILSLCSFCFIIFRIFYCVFHTKSPKKPRGHTLNTVIVLGSGGHTTEMLKLLKNFNFSRYTPTTFVLSHSDTTSIEKVISFKLQNIDLNYVRWIRIYRSREVKQTWISTLFTTTYSIIQAVSYVYSIRPDVLIINGPGTCLPLCVASILLRLLGVTNTRIVFVESFCRVRSLSLTGFLVYPIVDTFVVQWPYLAEKYVYAKYIGKVC